MEASTEMKVEQLVMHMTSFEETNEERQKHGLTEETVNTEYHKVDILCQCSFPIYDLLYKHLLKVFCGFLFTD